MFARRHRDSTSSNATRGPVSPLQPTFDFGLNQNNDRVGSPISVSSKASEPFRVSRDSYARPYTSDGTAESRRSIVSLSPPVLPPIPRITTRHEGVSSSVQPGQNDMGMSGDAGQANAALKPQSSFERSLEFNFSGLDPAESAQRPAPEREIHLRPATAGHSASSRESLRPQSSFERSINFSTMNRKSLGAEASSDEAPGPAAPYIRPERSSSLLDINFDFDAEDQEPKMEASMFPRPQQALAGNAFAPGPAMSRNFIDSRDKPYAQPAHRPPPIQSSYSSPDMLSLRSPGTVSGSRSPLSPQSSAAARLSPQTAASSAMRRPPSNTATSYSGSTARTSTHSSATTATSPLQHQQTIGTPYGETSPSFPLPQHVATRPKTVGSSSTIAGVMVPTHHTGGPDKSKADKRKTRLLNPMSLLVRRRSEQNAVPAASEEEIRAHAQAQARQKSVATAGINKIPEDFDPRIKGKIVHDFNAPRIRRNYSYSENDPQSPDQQLQSANSAPLLPSISGIPDVEPQKPTMHSKQPSDSSSRYSRQHTPVFVEHIDDDTHPRQRVNSIQAENLENKDFLQRVSHQSTQSAESAILPPFARRSQQMDPMQAAFFRDDESSKRSSENSSGNERHSGHSSSDLVSPINARQSGLGIDGLASASPVSPEGTESSQRPFSGMSGFPRPPSSEMLGEARSRSQSELTARPARAGSPKPTVGTIDEKIASAASFSAQQWSTGEPAQRNSRDAPGTLSLPNYDVNNMVPSPLSSPRFDSSTASTPEPAVADAAISFAKHTNPPKLVEKRASAVGHAKRLSTGPKHRVSNASRFSFQMGGSADEEQMLEEKHRKMAASGGSAAQSSRKPQSPDEDDEDDYFDEDAMDDEDEMETQMREHGNDNHHPDGYFPQQHLQPPVQDSDEGSIYDDEIPDIRASHDLSYAEHPSFKAHSALNSRHVSLQPNPWRGSGVDEYVSNGHNANHQRYFSEVSMMSDDTMQGKGVDTSRSNFYLQPSAAGYKQPMNLANLEKTQELPRSDEVTREPIGSPISVGSGGTAPNRESALSGSTVQSGSSNVQGPPTAATTVSPEPHKRQPSAQMYSGFSDFDFTEGPDLSLNNSRATSPQQGHFLAVGNRDTMLSAVSPPMSSAGFVKTPQTADFPHPPGTQRSGWDSMPRSPGMSAPDMRQISIDTTGASGRQSSAAYHGSVGKGIRARNASINQNQQYAASESEGESQDDMYFDDGGFDEDIEHPPHHQMMDERNFDNPDFLGGFKGMEPRGHQRGPSAMTIASLGSDGPYPTFANPNPVKARQRDSRMLLEDLPLQAPVDPRWIPQRNPSEDAKRLGLSNKVPPLPPQAGSQDAIEQAQSRMSAYHQALADAANKAAADGRFLRQLSVSTARSGSVYSKQEEEQVSFRDDRSHYSRDENGIDGNGLLNPNPAGVGRSLSQVTSGSRNDVAGVDYSPQKLNFDFGFNADNAAPSDFVDFDDGNDDLDDDYMNDDDVIAAANAEALENDDDGFYGQEFGFYAKQRRDSTENLEAINGGFFGEDGDDGLQRNKSLKEPNLTPITERSEFSTRNSFIGLGHFGPPSARLPISPLAENAPINFDTLARIRAGAFGGSERSSMHSAQSPSVAFRNSQASGYFGNFPPIATPGSANGHDSPARAWPHQNDSPVSAASSARGMPYSNHHQTTTVDLDATPRKPAAVQVQSPPETAKKTKPVAGHARQSSGADSVTYVREEQGAGQQPRWVLERRRTSEMGTEVVGREVVKGGWI